MQALSPQKWTTLCWINELLKEVTSIRGQKEKIVCSYCWCCPYLGQLNWLHALCGFILCGFHVNLSASFPADTFIHCFTGPQLFSQQRQVVCQPHSILLPENSVKISKAYKPITGCISPQRGMLQWVISDDGRYLSPWHREVYKYTNCSTITLLIFLAKQVYCTLRITDRLSDLWSLKG